MGGETEEEKVEQISESTLGTKRKEKMWNLGSKEEVNVEFCPLNNMQGHTPFSLGYFYKSLNL